MPIYVDHDERRGKIIAAAIRVLGDVGYAKFTLREVGKRLGGSTTMVTHYFPSRDNLLDQMLETILEEARATQENLIALPDPHDRLEGVLRYFLPIDDDALATEKARVALSSYRNTQPLVERHLSILEPRMRDLIRTALSAFIGPDELEPTVDLIRLWTAGVVLSTIEHPEIWTPERQNQALQHFMALIDLPVAAA